MNEESNHSFVENTHIMLETVLREIAQSQDQDIRQHLTQMLNQETPHLLVEHLLEILQEGDVSLGVVAVQVIGSFEYPQNKAAVPTLLAFVSEPTLYGSPEGFSPLSVASLRALVQMGPVMLFELVAEMAEDPELTHLVYVAFTYVGAYVFTYREDMEILLPQIINVLSQYREAALPVVIFVLTNPLKEWWDAAIQIGEAIGYPDNAPLIYLIIMHACDGNNPARGDAFHFLSSLDSERLVPFLLRAFWLMRPGVELEGYYRWIDFRGLCEIFTAIFPSAEKTPLLACLPMICYVFSVCFLTTTDENALPLSYKYSAAAFLEVLETIGETDLAVAIPPLLALAHQHVFSEVRERAQHLLNLPGLPTRAYYGECFERL